MDGGRMIPVIVIVWYILCAFILSRRILRSIHAQLPSQCDAEGLWYSRNQCLNYHAKGCWRTPEFYRLNTIILATCASFLWPLTLLPLHLMSTPRPVDIQAEINRLEKELKMGGD